MNPTLFLTLLLFSISCLAQERKASVDPYRNIYSLISKNNVQIHWADDESYLWYKVNAEQGKHEFFVVKLPSGEKQKAFDSKKLSLALKKFTGNHFNPNNLPISSLEFSRDFTTVQFITKGQALTCSLPNYEITKSSLKEKPVKTIDSISKSDAGGNKVNFTVKNSSDEEIELFWIDFKGQQKAYGKINAQSSKSTSSYAKHVWLIRNSKKQIIRIFSLPNAPSRLEIVDTNPIQKKKTLPRHTSPDGKWRAFTQNNNLFIKDLQSNQSIQLSKKGSPKDTYTNSFYWSPDSKKLICLKEVRVKTRTISIVESSPKDQLQPKVHTVNYAKPGDELPFKRPKLFDIDNAREIPVSEELFNNPFSNSRFSWRSDSKSFTFLHNQRGHQALRLISIDAVSGQVKALINETSKTFVHYSGKTFLEQIDESNEIIWMSERSGWNHLYLIDGDSGTVKIPITSGNWLVRKVLNVDRQKREIIFEAGCLYPNQDPYHVHICRVKFDGSEFTPLTSGDGTHKVEFSPGKNYVIAKWSRIDQAQVSEVRSFKTGKLICELEKADMSQVLKSGWKAPVRFTSIARDGKTDIWGIIIQPRDFDPKKSYPVIEQIYAGPHGSHVPKSFSILSRQHKLADKGFIVVQIDGMGTSNRSKKFHDYCWKNLGDGGFPDRILWMKAAAKKSPQMDLSRVGIYGGSAGGQNALRALLAFGDFYKVAAADCGCHDNRMDKIWWNEQWMGWPIDKHYDEQSNVTQAHKLKGKLLLTVGELDKNVDPASTMQVANALIKAGKEFELIVFPGGGHGSGWNKYGTKRLHDFFIRAFYDK